jgi:hypothetical protein
LSRCGRATQQQQPQQRFGMLRSFHWTPIHSVELKRPAAAR